MEGFEKVPLTADDLEFPSAGHQQHIVKPGEKVVSTSSKSHCRIQSEIADLYGIQVKELEALNPRIRDRFVRALATLISSVLDSRWVASPSSQSCKKSLII